MKQKKAHFRNLQQIPAYLSWQSSRLNPQPPDHQTPMRAIFDEIYFVLCDFRSVRLSDRIASDFHIVKNQMLNFIGPNIGVCVGTCEQGFSLNFTRKY